MITRAMVRQMQRGSVIVDATAGYGSGYIETMPELTTPDAPAIRREGVLHIKVDRYPALVPQTTVQRMAPVFCQLVEAVCASVPWMRTGLVVADGAIVNDEVRRHFIHARDHGMSWVRQ